MDENFFLHLYKTLIRPIVEYGNVIWCPNLKKDIVAIEKIQRRATKVAPTLRYLPYKERLQRLYLTTSEVRRRYSDLLQTYKIFNGIDEIDHKLFFVSKVQIHTHILQEDILSK